MKTKKKYEKPAMQVYDFPQQSRLLVGSDTGATAYPMGEPETL